jgi:hypothetical protein
MRGGGSWLPFLGIMVAVIVLIKALDLLWPLVKRKIEHLRKGKMMHEHPEY